MVLKAWSNIFFTITVKQNVLHADRFLAVVFKSADNKMISHVVHEEFVVMNHEVQNTSKSLFACLALDISDKVLHFMNMLISSLIFHEHVHEIKG